jgi:hypothetical protein
MARVFAGFALPRERFENEIAPAPGISPSVSTDIVAPREPESRRLRFPERCSEYRLSPRGRAANSALARQGEAGKGMGNSGMKFAVTVVSAVVETAQ